MDMMSWKSTLNITNITKSTVIKDKNYKIITLKLAEQNY